MKFCADCLKLYAVTDRRWLKGISLPQAVEEAVKSGVTMVQLREKNMDFEEFTALAKEVKKVTDKYKVPFVINDNVAVALACDADGVHVGQSDMCAFDVRAKIGPEKILGVSARTTDQAMLAAKMGADYIGIGAVFSTGTKNDAEVLPLGTYNVHFLGFSPEYGITKSHSSFKGLFLFTYILPTSSAKNGDPCTLVNSVPT